MGRKQNCNLCDAITVQKRGRSKACNQVQAHLQNKIDKNLEWAHKRL